jgi:Zn-dependent protease
MPMDPQRLLEGLGSYAAVIVIITFHEFGHAWMASKCGDDTARAQGRVSLNPIVHLDLVGTVVLPLLVVLLSASGSGLANFIIGWGKPVPVNVYRLRRPRVDDLLVAMAGPAMNVVLALVAMGAARVGLLTNASVVVNIAQHLALLSMYLCFFNLLPIPPLDGSYVIKSLSGMSHETFWRLAQFGFIAVILVVQIPQIRLALASSTVFSVRLMAKVLGFGGA